MVRSTGCARVLVNVSSVGERFGGDGRLADWRTSPRMWVP